MGGLTPSSRRIPAARLVEITLTTVLIAACAGPGREESLDAIVGEDIEVAMEAFGQPSEIIDLDQGRHVYVWRRHYNYDVNRRARSWPERRLAGWEEPSMLPSKSRVCSTRLFVSFDLVVEGWEYGCETVVQDEPPVEEPTAPQAD